MTSTTTATIDAPQANRAGNAIWYGVAILAVAALAGFIVLVMLMVKGAGVERIPLVDAPPPAVVPAPGAPIPGQSPAGPGAPGPQGPGSQAPGGPGSVPAPNAPGGPPPSAVRPPASVAPPAPAPSGAPR